MLRSSASAANSESAADSSNTKVRRVSVCLWIEDWVNTESGVRSDIEALLNSFHKLLLQFFLALLHNSCSMADRPVKFS